MRDLLSTFLDNPGARKARRGQPRPADAPDEPEFATGEAKPRRRPKPHGFRGSRGFAGCVDGEGAAGRSQASAPSEPNSPRRTKRGLRIVAIAGRPSPRSRP